MGKYFIVFTKMLDFSFSFKRKRVFLFIARYFHSICSHFSAFFFSLETSFTLQIVLTLCVRGYCVFCFLLFVCWFYFAFEQPFFLFLFSFSNGKNPDSIWIYAMNSVENRKTFSRHFSHSAYCKWKHVAWMAKKL